MTLRPVPASVAKQAELRRLDGNAFFKKQRIGAAIDAYTEVSPTPTAYFLLFLQILNDPRFLILL